MALSVLVSNCTQFLSNLIFLPLITVIGDSLTFLIFFLICCLGYVFIAVCLIETKGQQPEEILQSYRILMQRFLSISSEAFPLSRQKQKQIGEGKARRNIQFAAVSNVLIGGTSEEHGVRAECGDEDSGPQVGDDRRQS
jgi:hypothetical protein